METRRDRIESILGPMIHNPEMLNRALSEVTALYKSQDDIVHEIGPEGRHRLIVNGETSEWGSSTDIIRNGDYVATTDAFINILFQVTRIKPVEGFVTRTVQD